MEDPSGFVPVRTAFISVHDKSGVLEFVRKLVAAGVKLYCSRGTAQYLRSAGVECTSTDEIVGKAEYVGGRVKTLHPLVYAAVLADRGSPAHLKDLEEAGVLPFDLVCVSLYPFEEVVSAAGALLEEIVENIDIGGPSMIRAAAKNFRWVAVVSDKSQYDEVGTEISSSGGLSYQTRIRLAREAFARTCSYDGSILRWIQGVLAEHERRPPGGAPSTPEHSGEPVPVYMPLFLRSALELRYGENPHQTGAFYELAGEPSLLGKASILGGKELSYNNLLDLDAAWSLVTVFEEPTAVIVKHTNPCGVASASSLEKAYEEALACDPVSAFGGVLACNRKLDSATATKIAEVFTEVVAAPDFEDEAIEILRKRKGLRMLKMPYGHPSVEYSIKSCLGGILLQTPDRLEEESDWRVVSEREPTDEELEDLRFAWKVCAACKSNSVVIANGRRAVGIGTGDQSRVGAAERAIKQAGERAEGGVAASEAFFPFRDGVDALAAAGVRAIIQPGGSVRDKEVIEAVNEAHMAMIFTGRRHFRHG